MRTNIQLLPAWTLLGFLTLMLCAILVLPTLGLNPVLAGLLMVGLAVAIPLIDRPKYLFWLYFVWAFVLRCAQVIFPLARFGDELLIVLWLVVLLGMLGFRRLEIRDHWFMRLFLGLVFLCILSKFVNGSNTKKMIIFLLSYMFPLLTFYLARTFLTTKRDMILFVKVVVGLFLLQFLLNMGWVFRINPLPNLWLYTHDFAIGSFNSQTYVAYFCSFIFITLLGSIAAARSSRRKVLLFVLLLLVASQFVLTFTLHAYLLLAIGLAVYAALFISGKKVLIVVPSFVIAGVLAVFLLFAMSDWAASKYGAAQSVREELRPEYLRWRLDRMVKGPKGQCYEDAFYNSPSEKPLRWFVGAGPGDFISTVAMYQVPYSELTMRYLGKYYLTYTGEMERAGHSITQAVVASPPVLMGELGVVGLILYTGIGIGITWIVLKNIYNQRYQNRLQLVLARGFVASLSIIFIISLLIDILDLDCFVILFTTWGALLVDPIQDNEDYVEIKHFS